MLRVLEHTCSTALAKSGAGYCPCGGRRSGKRFWRNTKDKNAAPFGGTGERRGHGFSG